MRPRNVFAWYLTRTVDLFGNDIVYEYERERDTTGVHQYEQTYLRRIRYADYGGADSTTPKKYLVSVEFDYDTRPDPFSDYSSGFEQRTTLRCTGIRTLTHPRKPTAHPRADWEPTRVRPTPMATKPRQRRRPRAASPSKRMP